MSNIYTRQYLNRVNWQNMPSVSTPMDADDLNQMDLGIQKVDAAVKEAVDILDENLNDAVAELQENFGAGVDAVYDAVVAKGSTPSSHALDDVVDGIMAIPTGGGGIDTTLKVIKARLVKEADF